MTTKIHIAGVPANGIQKCDRCGTRMDSKHRHPEFEQSFWAVHHFVEVSRHGWSDRTAGAKRTPDAVLCKVRGEAAELRAHQYAEQEREAVREYRRYPGI